MTVIARITSGLGNQLFQYAYGTHIANALNASLRIDTSWFDHFQNHSPKRSCRLNCFKIPDTVEYTRGVKRLALGISMVNSRLIKQLAPPLLERLNISVWAESRPFHYEEIDFSTLIPDHNLLLSGYWQLARPYLTHSELLHDYFMPAIELSPQARRWQEKIENSNSVFVHVRRGDYLNFGGGGLGIEYYRKSLPVIQNQIADVTWFVFSDDLPWCRKNLNLAPHCEFVQCDSPFADVEELYLMTRCKGGIMANSSFSWWGAALGTTPNRPIICPRYWWGKESSDYPDLRLPSWKAIPNLLVS